MVFSHFMHPHQNQAITSATRMFLLVWISLAFQTAENVFAREAVITPSGLNTQVSLSSTPPPGQIQYDITGGTRPGGERNLFHSFGEFGVPSNHIANFLNETKLPTDNILARVTGDNASVIFGTIQAKDFGSANLFFLNPRGFIFGPTAILNVGGSVAFTSADYIKLADNVRFNAMASSVADTLLSASPVASFGFLGSNPGAITVSGSTLTVKDNQSISLVGGNVIIQSSVSNGGTTKSARLSAPSGTIFLATAGSPGEFDSMTIDPLANANGTSFSTSGSVSLKPNSSIDVHGMDTVSIKGGQFVLSLNNSVLLTDTGPALSNAISLTNDSSIVTSSSNTIPGTDIDIVTETLRLDSSRIQSNTTGTGRGGNITIQTGQAALNEASSINTNTLAHGNAGNVRIRADESIVLVNSSQLNSTSFDIGNGAGNAGQLWLTSPIITLQGSQLISNSIGVANAGNIQLEASTLTLRANDVGSESKISADTLGHGRGGDITIHGVDGFGSRTGDVIVTGGSSITSTTSGNGDAGTISVSTERASLTDGGALITSSVGSGNAGNMKIDATQSLEVFSNSGIESIADLEGSGNAGKITINTPTLTLKSGGQVSASSTSKGNAGTITIGSENSAHSILIDGLNSSIFTDTTGIGAGGSINIFAQSLLIQNSGTISAKTSGTTARATGGGINITASDHTTLANGASITASTSGPGNAGDILVKANDITVSGGSSVTASSTGTGNAGTVTIQGLQSSAHSLRIDGVDSGIFTRTSNTGTGGDITVSANSVRVQNQSSISGEISGTAATAIGGKIRVEGNTIHIEKGSLVTSSSTGAGSGGNIKLTAGQSVSIFDGASISASSTGTGAAGNIEIDAGLELDVQRGSITTQSTELSGGNIDIRAIDLLRVVDGKISTSALNGGGNGGAITIDPKVVLLQNSDILAQANRGNGGDISITTPVFVADQSSRVDASTPFGLNGRVTIQAPTSNLSGTVGQLVSKTSPPQVLLQNRCVALAGGEQSTFLLAGRETLPVEPSGWLSSPVSMEHWTGEEAAHASRLMVRNRELNSSAVMTAQTSRTPVLSLRRLTPPGFLVRTFAPGVTGCPS